MTLSSRAAGRTTLSLAFACFVALGIANALLGVAWPSMRHTFGLSLDAVVALLTSSTVGFFSGCIFAGGLMSRFGIARFLLMANILAAVGLVGYSISPGWWLLVCFGLLSGFAAGAIDTGLNIYIAATSTVRMMNWMHAMYGVGATIGPLFMTSVIGAGFGWRVGYAISGLVHLALGLLFFTALGTVTFRSIDSGLSDGETSRTVSLATTLRLPIVFLSLIIFLLYTGVESATGQWSFSLFTESRSVSTYQAGFMTSLFWAMLTIGRIMFGAAADRIGITRLLRWSMIGTVISAALFMVRNPVVGFAAVSLMGLSLSAIFPTLTSITTTRVGRQHAANAIGMQTGAASVGFVILPSLVGVLAARRGLEILGPFLLVAALLMLLINEAAIRVSGRHLQLDKVSTSPVSQAD